VLLAATPHDAEPFRVMLTHQPRSLFALDAVQGSGGGALSGSRAADWPTLRARLTAALASAAPGCDGPALLARRPKLWGSDAAAAVGAAVVGAAAAVGAATAETRVPGAHSEMADAHGGNTEMAEMDWRPGGDALRDAAAAAAASGDDPGGWSKAPRTDQPQTDGLNVCARSTAGVVVTYDAVPRPLRAAFLDWLFCNDVSVVMAVRDAAVDSVWEAEVRARVARESRAAARDAAAEVGSEAAAAAAGEIPQTASALEAAELAEAARDETVQDEAAQAAAREALDLAFESSTIALDPARTAALVGAHEMERQDWEARLRRHAGGAIALRTVRWESVFPYFAAWRSRAGLDGETSAAKADFVRATSAAALRVALTEWRALLEFALVPDAARTPRLEGGALRTPYPGGWAGARPDGVSMVGGGALDVDRLSRTLARRGCWEKVGNWADVRVALQRADRLVMAAEQASGRAGVSGVVEQGTAQSVRACDVRSNLVFDADAAALLLDASGRPMGGV
jgi:hypothetical protein